MAANQITVKAWKGPGEDIPPAAVVENGRLAFYVDTSASTHVVKVCRKVAGTPTWDTIALASEVLAASVLTTTGDLLVRGASAPERLAVGALGQTLRVIGAPLTPTWVDAAKYGTLAARSAANEAHQGVPYYVTDAQVPALGVRTGASTYGWHTLATALYGLAGARPTAGAEYATCVYYATDATSAAACVRTGAGSYAWVSLGGVSDPTTTRGDLLVRGASALERLAVGNSGQVLTSNGTDAVWGGVQSIGGAVAPIYSAAASRPAASASYAGALHYATDTLDLSVCVRTGASAYAWLTLTTMP